ncbi:MAG: YgaP family membrane protein [Rhodospirillales bacterium]
MLPDTAERVPHHTAAHVNARIEDELEASVAYHARHPGAIADRLAELDRECDIERILEANAAAVSLVGVTLAATVDRKWLALPAAVGGFLLQHALQGWCPPLELFRRLGVRTAGEIARERYALKALRGDFALVAGATDDRADAALRAVAR